MIVQSVSCQEGKLYCIDDYDHMIMIIIHWTIYLSLWSSVDRLSWVYFSTLFYLTNQSMYSIIHLPIHLSILYIYSINSSILSIYPSTDLFHLSIHPSYPSIYPSIHPSIYPSHLSIYPFHLYIYMIGLLVKWDGWFPSDRILWSPQCRRPITAYLWMMPSGRYIDSMVSYHIIFIYQSITSIYLSYLCIYLWWA